MPKTGIQGCRCLEIVQYFPWHGARWLGAEHQFGRGVLRDAESRAPIAHSTHLDYVLIDNDRPVDRPVKRRCAAYHPLLRLKRRDRLTASWVTRASRASLMDTKSAWFDIVPVWRCRVAVNRPVSVSPHQFPLWEYWVPPDRLISRLKRHLMDPNCCSQGLLASTACLKSVAESCSSNIKNERSICGATPRVTKLAPR